VKLNVRENEKLKIEMKRKKDRYFDWDQMVTGDRKVEEAFALLPVLPP
jgi:hypothetical protein